MKYIRIKNLGHIEPEALYLIGASTKRGDTTKIGQFGSGNKYALAYLLRNGYTVRVFAGLQEISIETRPASFRGADFDVIHINGQQTGISTAMGKDWQFWQAIREVYCNAIDEGGCDLDFVMNIDPADGETHFYIDTKKDVLEFVGNFDNYFATRKKVLFECPAGRILAKSGESANIYRKVSDAWTAKSRAYSITTWLRSRSTRAVLSPTHGSLLASSGISFSSVPTRR